VRQVPTFERVEYPGLYDGVDLQVAGRRASLKYEFHIAPGADYRQIQVSYDGIDALRIAADGSLQIQTELGELTDDAPYIYQEIDGQRVEVAGQFELVDTDTYAFDVTGAYEPNVELVIDPDLAGPYSGLADMNQDGGVNGLDIDPFVTAVVGAGGLAADATAAGLPARDLNVGVETNVPAPAIARLTHPIVGAHLIRRQHRPQHSDRAHRIQIDPHAMRHRMVDRIFGNTTDWLRSLEGRIV
jgi:hypothetical protein